MKKKKIIILAILTILLLSLILVFSNKTFDKYSKFKEHKDYFKQDREKQEIENWMTLRMIEHRYDLDLDKELSTDVKFRDKRETLEEYCSNNNLNLNQTIQKLNQIAKEKREKRDDKDFDDKESHK